jgi:hypothetical protein
MIPRRRCVRIHPYVDAALAQRLAVHCASTGLSISKVVEQALGEHLGDEKRTLAVLLGLERIGRAIERMHRDLELLMEAFGIWVKIWFAHTPRIDGQDLDLVRRLAESRFAEFVEEVAQDYSSDHHFLEDLWRAVLEKRADHSAAIAQGSTAIRRTDASGDPHDK